MVQFANFNNTDNYTKCCGIHQQTYDFVKIDTIKQ